MIQVHRPPGIYLNNQRAPVLFLAGPIQGTSDWQTRATGIIEMLDQHAREFIIANPRQPLVEKNDFEASMFAQQVRWEHAYLCRARNFGVTMFWLANEEFKIEGRSYAQTSRVELGELLGFVQAAAITGKLAPVVVVGFDSKFTGRRYLELDLKWKAPEIVMCETLEDTCTAAYNLVTETPCRPQDHHYNTDGVCTKCRQSIPF